MFPKNLFICNCWIVPFFILSCAKVGYLYKQGKGQFQLLYRGRPNHEVLADPEISPQDKGKIEKVMEYKKWFYAYWGMPESAIYSKTTFLKDNAVSYLVTASPHHRIEAKEECFPFMGCFPYLGYFDRKDARARARTMEKDGWVTWIRPVYAYSSLGKLNDRILSSFFHYDDRELAELVFHELFHTMFFVKNEVELNENLANFFAVQMRSLYFKEKPTPHKHESLHQPILAQIDRLNGLYAQEKHLTQKKSKQILNHFIKTQFNPSIRRHCQQHNIAPCFPLEQKWNNARFAAFLTYQGQEERIHNLYQRLKKEKHLSIKDFFLYIKDRHEGHNEKKEGMSFADSLLKEV